MTANSESVINEPLLHKPIPQRNEEAGSRDTAIAHKKSSSQQLLTNKFITHQTKSGLNPLVDAAAYLFSVIGKLKLLKSYRHLSNLQKELTQEINHFQDTAKAQGYSSEYIIVSRYALCATLDDVIANTSWGGQGQWDSYCLLNVFNQDSVSHDRFFIILERIIKDPAQYIDVMELMYICLSLGFKGNYRTTEFGSNQLEQITNALYKRIRIQRGDYNNSLAPYAIKPIQASKSVNTGIPLWLVTLITAAIILVIFLGLGYMLDTISNQAYQELMHIGKSLLYETTHS
ncbi:MAG: type IVB secretion system protein IcmH/DotU [Gammaproteobacteria bacterium]